jgi:hypothetical protein
MPTAYVPLLTAPHAAELTTYDTPGSYSFTIPSWVNTIDRVALGGGRAGRVYGFGVGSNGGKAGSFAWDTLHKGVDFASGDTISVIVGAGGASNGAAGGDTTLTVNGNVLTGAAGLTDAYVSGYTGQPVNTGNANSNKDLLLNGQTYVGGSGGTGTSSNDPAGPPVVPGGGGWGSNANGINGRPGGNGRAWLNAY